jgi:probable HAF family extracellular repeat protein
MSTLRNNVMHHCAVLAVLLLAAPAEAAWVVSEIPMLPGWAGGVEASDISSNGVVCGNGNYVVNVSSTPFRFDGTTVTELPHLTPADPLSLARSINVHGVICGQSHRSDGKERAVYWEGTTLHVIPYAPDCNTNSYCQALDINDSGVIVGFYWNTNGERTAFYYENGTTHSLDSALRGVGLYGTQIASGINNNVVCGSADDAGGNTTAFTYDIDTGVATNIGNVGWSSSATDINNSGQTIGRGQQTSFDKYRAVTYDGAWHVVDPTVDVTQWGEAINDKGRMVGHANISDSKWSWYSDGPGAGSILQLDLPGWSRGTAQGINNNDWIVGYGRTATSGTDTRAFVLARPPGDADHDGDVDLDDHAEFAACLSGPKEAAGFVPPSSACLKTFDFDPADDDVDLADFAAFQQAFTGAGG